MSELFFHGPQYDEEGAGANPYTEMEKAGEPVLTSLVSWALGFEGRREEIEQPLVPQRDLSFEENLR